MTNRIVSQPPPEAIMLAARYRGWSQNHLAWVMGVSQPIVSMLQSGHRSITPKVALRLEAALGGSAEAWVDLQRDYDLMQLRESMAAELNAIVIRAMQ